MYLLFYPKGHPCMQLRLGLTPQECPLVIAVLTTSFHIVLLQLAQILTRVSNKRYLQVRDPLNRGGRHEWTRKRAGDAATINREVNR